MQVYVVGAEPQNSKARWWQQGPGVVPMWRLARPLTGTGHGVGPEGCRSNGQAGWGWEGAGERAGDEAERTGMLTVQAQATLALGY